MKTTLVALAALLLLSPGLQAAETPAAGKSSNASSEPGAVGENSPGLAENAMAQQLIRYGITKNDPLPLITAAKIMKQNPVTVDSKKKTSEVDTAKDPAAGGEDEKAKGNEDLSTADAVLGRAKEMAAGKADVMAMVDSVSAYSPPKTRGRVGGPAYHYDRVRRYSTDVFNVNFRGQQQARISIQGDGDSNLDCYVYDENHYLVESDSNWTDTCDLSWTPSWTGTFYLKVVNRGRSSNRYVVLTN